ncbi:TniQ family protein [Neorhizobium galegae]|uniref:TniQ family protein n=1 Tax=Neorhizobium galegae TaxID=399 RepID=UPI002105A708|nr:TniQ family protein [Neorhizobium galegae]MCQ1780421.1 TniQ family protein [Neorhizobium galegae]MCQ1799137.1 TniQ family protein [Neorhizobium galegae]
MNGIDSAAEFASHFGFDYGRLAEGSHPDIKVFSDLVGIAQDRLAPGLIMQTKGLVKLAAGEFSREFLETDRCRFCPACVASDIGPKQRLHLAFGRVEWMLKFIHTCPQHGIRLQTVSGNWSKAADFSAQLRTAIANIKNSVGTRSSATTTGFQNYVINRVRGGPPQGIWLDKFPLQAAAHFTQLLGALRKNGREPELEEFDEHDWIAVAGIG